MTTTDVSVADAKRAAAYAAIDAFVQPGMCLGLGTGSTAYWSIKRVAEMVASGWTLSAVPTSLDTERLCIEHGIPVRGLLGCGEIDVAFDGADEVDADLTLIKGGLGALFRERAVAIVARTFVVVVTEAKLVSRVGAVPLPVEVVPFALPYVQRELTAAGADARVRASAQGRFMTDNGNHILDCSFERIAQAGELDRFIRSIHGVVSTGLFVGLADHAFVGGLHGVRVLSRSRAADCQRS